MHLNLVRNPSAAVPFSMSFAALVVIAVHIIVAGTAPQPDEGTAAHLWQLLMAAQLPVIAVFAVKWLPQEPRQTLVILFFQGAAMLAAAFPVWWFRW
jgi:hypothetical protein